MNEVLPATTDNDIIAVRQLFQQYAASLDIDLCFQNFERELASLPEDYAPPRGALFFSRADGTGELYVESSVTDAYPCMPV